ncbi:MAG: hypothetical protein K2I73_00700 [Eubacterium sp.]|nr:hypothetical protein [Eubacterium sp.]
MRYNYALKKKEERNGTNLKEYENEIKEALEYLNVGKENYITINEDSFEFSYSGCISRGYLQEMGKRLSKLGVGKEGFVRQKNKAYAFLSYDKSRTNDEQILVELVDCSTVDGENEYFLEEMPQWVNFYRRVELSTTCISLEKAKKIFNRFYEPEDNKEIVFLVEFKHRHLEINKYHENINSDFIYDYKSNKNNKSFVRENTCLIEHLYSDGVYQPDFVDLADITSVGVITEPKRKSLLSKFDVKIDSYPGVQYNANILSQNTKYTFTVHNVGQALATSLSEKGQKPFFYFDYGIACGKNARTLPKNIKLPIAKDATILLSHVDEDHWCGFRINQEALKCRWIIPQNPRKALKKTLSSVYSNGGTIIQYSANGLSILKIKSLNNCMVAGNSQSTINSSRSPKKTHETGNALYIFAQYKGKEYKIVISGDQDYDYQDNSYFNDINLLVACHHGGEFSWSKRAAIPIPNSVENKIVYSYGDGNSYGHPSKVSEHSKNGWNIEHHTPKDGNFEIDLELIDNTRTIKPSSKLPISFEI